MYSILERKTKILLLLGISLAGCTTTLTSTKVDLGSDLALKDVGSTYYLPQQTINTAITYDLISCVTEDLKPNVQIIKSAAISTSNSPDGNARFHVPAASLSSGNKTTSLTISTFDDGTLRALGATVDDRTSESIGGIVNSAGSILGIATGVNPAFSPPSTIPDSTIPECSGNLMKIVKARDDMTKNLRDPSMFLGEAERAAAIDVLNRLTALTRHTRNISFIPDPNAPIPDPNAPMPDPNAPMPDPNAPMPDPNAPMPDPNAPMPDPNASNVETRVSKVLDESASTESRLNSWLDGKSASLTLVANTLKTVICIRPGIDGGVEIGNFKHRCGRYLDQSSPSPSYNMDSAKNPIDTGLIYRDPKNVRVIVCGENCNDNDKGGDIIGQSQVALAQFGPWRSIELTSKAFQDKNVMASWNNSGRLTSLTVGSSSSLEAIANTLNTSASSIRGTVGEIVTTDQEALNAEIALIRSQADLIEQQNRLNALQISTTD